MRLSGERKRQRIIKRNNKLKLERKQLKMPFKMKFDQEKLEGLQPVPAGIYKVLFLEFKPKHSKSVNKVTGAKSINLNAYVKILDHPEFETERKVVASLNEGVPSFIQDFVHSFGMEMEDQLGAEPSIPGTFDADKNKFKADDPTTWVYSGPLTNKTAQWELGIKDYNGKPTQTIKRFICSVPNCATRFPKVRHSQDMAKNEK